MNPEIVNIYIERLIQEVQELTKTKLLTDTQLKYTELLNKKLSDKVTDLESQLEKINKKKTKEVNTSNEF
jgi:phage shock protein A